MPAAGKTNPFDQDFLPIRCEGCNEQGYIFAKYVITAPYFVVCPHCQFETSSVWCPKCEMGGEYVENVKDRPGSWKCPGCKTEYPLPSRFYNKPVTLYLESNLPDDVLDLVRPKNRSRPVWLQTTGILVFFAGIPILIGVLAGLVLDTQLMLFTGFTSFLSFLAGLVAPLYKNSSWKNWLMMVGISIVPVACGITGVLEPPGPLALIISYILGVIYGLGFARFLVWYNSRAGKTTATAQK